MHASSPETSNSAQSEAVAPMRRATPVTWCLIAIHLSAFGLLWLRGADADAGLLTMLVLYGSAAHPLAILLHPFGTQSLVGIALVILTLWGLGRPLEQRIGTVRLVAMYVIANLLTGAVFFAFAQAVPEFAVYPLRLPAGGLAALACAARLRLGDVRAYVLGRSFSLGRIAAAGAAIVAGWVFFWGAEGATAWLVAAAVGGLAWPIVRIVGRDA